MRLLQAYAQPVVLLGELLELGVELTGLLPERVDTGSGPTYASGSTVTLNMIAPRIHLTGTTTVNTIMPAWNGQQLCIISDSGALKFGTRGNIAAAVSTSGAGGVVCGWYDGSFLKWRFR